jgi:hypothetical protein
MATKYEQLKNAGIIRSDYDDCHAEAAEALDQSEVESLIRIFKKLDDAHPSDAPSRMLII